MPGFAPRGLRRSTSCSRSGMRWPIAARPDARIGEHGDAYFSVWRLAWVAHQLKTSPLHLFDANIFYPEPRTLAYSDAMLLPATVLAPLSWAGARPLVVYNVFLLSTFVLNALAAYVLVYRLVGSYPAGLLAGVIFAFSPYRFEHFDHLEMQLSFWIPLAVLAWHRAVERQTTRDCLVVAAAISAQVLSCIYYGVFLITSLGVFDGDLVLALSVQGAPRGHVDAVTRDGRVRAVFAAIPRQPQPGGRQAGGRGGRVQRHAEGLRERPREQSSLRLDVSVRCPRAAPFSGAGGRRAPGRGPLAAAQSPPRRARGRARAGFQLALGTNGWIYDLLYEWVLPYRGLRVPARADILILVWVPRFSPGMESHGSLCGWSGGGVRGQRCWRSSSARHRSSTCPGPPCTRSIPTLRRGTACSARSPTRLCSSGR